MDVTALTGSNSLSPQNSTECWRPKSESTAAVVVKSAISVSASESGCASEGLSSAVQEQGEDPPKVWQQLLTAGQMKRPAEKQLLLPACLLHTVLASSSTQSVSLLRLLPPLCLPESSFFRLPSRTKDLCSRNPPDVQ